MSLSSMHRAAWPRLPGWSRRALALPEALATRLRRSVLALPLATAAVLAVVVINDMSHARSVQALARLEKRSLATAQVEAVQRRLLDGETALAGYLLTGRRNYLAPYEDAATDVAQALRWLRDHHRDDAIASTLLDTLATHADATLAHIARSVQAFDDRQRQQLPWQVELTRPQADAVRAVSAQLMRREHELIARERQAMFDTLRAGRIGVNAAATLGILALLVVLRQTAALNAAQRRHAQALQEEGDRLEAEVQRRTDDLTALAKHLQTVREDEGSRLARELHEELGALLTTAKLDVARLGGRLAKAVPEVHARLAHLGETIDSAFR